MHKKGIIICILALVVVLIAGSFFLFFMQKPMTATEKHEKLFADPISYELKFEGIDETVLFETYPNLAPKTVKNFDKLVKKGYYDGLSVHRVVNDVIIQTGQGDKASTIKGEFSDNGVDNPLKHTRGVISMARASDYNSASSQFFVVAANSLPSLDGHYAAFGMVTQGIEIIDEIAGVPCDDETPIDPPIIEYIKKI